tara:strand:+ start:421 stop:1803 length:1383 start_codon:yes stop_codon:yes gene_type:complete
MNIYLHVEISARELDGKLLLATLAAAKGHEIVLSDSEVILKGLFGGYLEPGIYHTKSLTPKKIKIDRHKELINKGMIITSIDEESGIHRRGYEQFAKARYSNESINQSSAVFCWGEEDWEILRKNYKEGLEKIFKTGSPRLDLCKPIFLDYWNTPKTFAKKPFLLISSNIGPFGIDSFVKRTRYLKEQGYFDRTPGLLKEHILSASNDYLKAFVFMEAIKYLSEHNNGYDIVVRPHPNENSDYWRVLLDGLPNVYVDKDGPINVWINNSFAVMHHGCTTAFESILSHKPVVTYAATELKDHHLQNQPPNDLGFLVKSKEDLLIKVNSLFEDSKKNFHKSNNRDLPTQISKKIFIDDKELSAEKIVKIWEDVSNNKNFKKINLTKFKLLILRLKIGRFIGDILKRLYPSKYSSLGTKKNNHKFTHFDINQIIESVEKFRKILKIEKKLECKLISDRTILIK